jgi:hypothetical protein
MILFGNDDVLVRVMEFLGPRHAIIGFGSTCRYLRAPPVEGRHSLEDVLDGPMPPPPPPPAVIRRRGGRMATTTTIATTTTVIASVRTGPRSSSGAP